MPRSNWLAEQKPLRNGLTYVSIPPVHPVQQGDISSLGFSEAFIIDTRVSVIPVKSPFYGGFPTDRLTFRRQTDRDLSRNRCEQCQFNLRYNLHVGIIKLSVPSPRHGIPSFALFSHVDVFPLIIRSSTENENCTFHQQHDAER